MCGRYTQMFTWVELHELYELSSAPVELGLHYNVTPGQQVPAVRAGDNGPELASLHWGLIPSWAKDKKIARKMSNARAETVAEKPAFRSAFKRRRCIIPASGFYEWQVQPKGPKQPFYIHPANNNPWSSAGLWEQWHGAGDEVVESCAIITTEANSLMLPLHARMPAIIQADQLDSWLDPKARVDELQSMLSPYSPDEMRAYPVSTWVNKPINDDRRCIDPLGGVESSGSPSDENQSELF